MRIAIDYDNTYTLDPMMWLDTIAVLERAGNEVRIVTARNQDLDKITDLPFWLQVIYCNGVAKEFYCEHFAGWKPDIWIDDKPRSIIENSPMTSEELTEWRANRV